MRIMHRFTFLPFKVIRLTVHILCRSMVREYNYENCHGAWFDSNEEQICWNCQCFQFISSHFPVFSAFEHCPNPWTNRMPRHRLLFLKIEMEWLIYSVIEIVLWWLTNSQFTSSLSFHIFVIVFSSVICFYVCKYCHSGSRNFSYLFHILFYSE